MEVITGEWIRDKLSESGKTQKQLADHAGLTPVQMSLILSGKRGISAAEAALIAGFFGAGEDLPELTPMQRDLLDAVRQLTAEEQDFLLTSARALTERRRLSGDE